MQSVLIKFFVTFAATLMNLAHTFRHERIIAVADAEKPLRQATIWSLTASRRSRWRKISAKSRKFMFGGDRTGRRIRFLSKATAREFVVDFVPRPNLETRVAAKQKDEAIDCRYCPRRLHCPGRFCARTKRPRTCHGLLAKRRSTPRLLEWRASARWTLRGRSGANSLWQQSNIRGHHLCRGRQWSGRGQSQSGPADRSHRRAAQCHRGRSLL